jgi:hypothetical protein
MQNTSESSLNTLSLSFFLVLSTSKLVKTKFLTGFAIQENDKYEENHITVFLSFLKSERDFANV